MMKNVYLILLLMIIACNISATNNLVLYLYSGTTISFPIEDQPKIVFEDGVISISTERFQINNVQKYTFSENEALSIEGVDTDEVKMYQGDKIVVDLNSVSDKVSVYSSKGLEQAVSAVKTDERKVVLDMSNLQPDVYVISVGNKSFKIRKK